VLSENVMPYTTFKKIGELELKACFMDVGLADSSTSKPLGKGRDIIITIDEFEFKIDVIISKDNKGQDYSMILGRSFMVTAKSLVDMELKEVFIRSNEKCNLAMEQLGSIQGTQRRFV